jgi:hypothetical protein
LDRAPHDLWNLVAGDAVKVPLTKETLSGRGQQVEAPNSTGERVLAGARPKLVPQSPTSKVGLYRERAQERNGTERLEPDGSHERLAEAAEHEVLEVPRVEVSARQVTSIEKRPHSGEVIRRSCRVANVLHEILHGEGIVCSELSSAATGPASLWE